MPTLDPPPPTLRLATVADLPTIDEIYNPYVLTSTCTYQTEPTSPAERAAWFANRGPGHPVTVAELDGRLVGWASISRFRDRAAYDRTVENAVYVRPEFHRQGIGSTLLVDSIARARAARHHAIVAVIDAEQAGSIALHERHGFTRVAHLREVGFKFGRWLDVVYLELLLPNSA
jgi:L-amino acid N-acyltransferase YncA